MSNSAQQAAFGEALAVGDKLPDADLRRADGSEVKLSEFVDGTTIVPIVRYYGCMPCRDFLLALEEERDEAAAAGISIVAVGKAAEYQAQWLMTEAGIGYELLMDPEENMYRALGLGRFPWWRMFAPRTVRNYLRAMRRARQGKPTNHPLQAPGLVVIDGDLRLRLVHRGDTLGDYPEASELLEHVRTDIATG